MLAVRFMKAAPTTYVLHFQNGRIRHEGPGLSFFYYAPTSTIISVPLASADAPFAFQESTADFQPVAIQGQLTYRVEDAKQLASLLDFSVDGRGLYRSEDYRKLTERLVHTAQTLMRAETQKMTLREALTGSEKLSTSVLAGLKSSKSVLQLGVSVLNLNLLSIRATPETSKALEAEAREALQRRSDEAIYARRNNAVEQERRIKESELNTEIVVEEKQQQIREAKMSADIAIEKQRSVLMDQRGENERKEADSRAYALTTTLEPLRAVDWRILSIVFRQGADPGALIAMAFQEIGANAQKIGELNISPDLLSSLLGSKQTASGTLPPAKGR